MSALLQLHLKSDQPVIALFVLRRRFTARAVEFLTSGARKLLRYATLSFYERRKTNWTP